MTDRSKAWGWRSLLVQAALAAAPSLAWAQGIDNPDELDALALADAPPRSSRGRACLAGLCRSGLGPGHGPR